MQEIYDYFCDMDEEEEGYILEVLCSIICLFDYMVVLFVYLLQRLKQCDIFYKLILREDEEFIL